MFYLILILIGLSILAAAVLLKSQILDPSVKYYRLNTSHPGKLKEFQRFFKRHGFKLKVSEIELDEVDADPMTVIVHKASQLDEGILVEDTSLEVEGAAFGVNVKWLIDDLEKYLGRKAVWTTLLAHRQHDEVHVYKGEVVGKIVRPRSYEGFGFDPYFLPEGATKTLSEGKIDQFNARAIAIENFVNGKTFEVHPPIYHWDGEWQTQD